MRIFLIFILLLFYNFSALSQADRSQTYNTTVPILPGDGNGFVGTVTMVYAFGNCFGDTVMAYGYKDLQLKEVKYKGQTYTPSALGLDNFNDPKLYTSLTRVDLSCSFNHITFNQKTLTYILDDYDLGCFGQTVTIASGNPEYNKNLGALGANFDKARFGMSITLADKIEALLKKDREAKEYRDIMVQVGNTTDLKEKLRLLKRAKKLASTTFDKLAVDNSIKQTEDAIENTKQEAKNSSKKSSSSSGLVLTSTSSKSKSTTKVPSKVSTVSSQSNSTSYSNSQYNAPSYNIQQSMYTNNKLYNNSFNEIDKAFSQLSDAIGSIMERKRKEREARERSRLLKEQRIKQEAQRKNNFYRRADKSIKEIKEIVNKRKQFFIANNAPTYTIDGSAFEPIYIIYAYTQKGYANYSDYASYPDIWNIGLKKEHATVYYSPVMAIFPFSNGTYPYFDDIKRNILNNHLTIDPNQYDIVFLDAQPSVDKIIKSLKESMSNAIYNHAFSSAVPSKEENIKFLNDKIIAATSSNYWGASNTVKGKKERIDYFGSSNTKKKTIDYFKPKDTTTTKTQQEYFKASQPKSKAKKDYWVKPNTKQDSTKSKNNI
ncbi:hypothetical protein ACFO5O_01615 [Geojedonia litorea]|uniref:Uncharacterized protein n=1 Tax=Geojedonia litorea TaxID=1268269 RepID=A0ABV9N2L1_9FLAO